MERLQNAFGWIQAGTSRFDPEFDPQRVSRFIIYELEFELKKINIISNFKDTNKLEFEIKTWKVLLSI